MIRWHALGISLLVLVFASRAWGQQQSGDFELQLQGSFFTTVGADVTNSVGTIAGKFGPFVTSNIQLGVGPTVTIATSTTSAFNPATGGTTATSSTKVTVGTTVFAVYSFLLKDARTVPYIGASYYKRDFSNTADKGWVGGNGGMKYFFARKAAIDVSANYLTSLNEETKGGLLLFAFGLSFLL